MAMKKVIRYCGDPAPGELVPASVGTMRCSREVSRNGHLGDHRAHKTVHRVGRVNVHWPQPRKTTTTQPPPVIDLRPTFGALKGGLVVNLDG